ncbi:MAG: OB-fold nucleic acid binding domain-containing protein [Chloroflexia bacterium]
MGKDYASPVGERPRLRRGPGHPFRSIAPFRVLALVLAGMGVLLCALSARLTRPPHLSLESIGPEQNLAYVQVSGMVLRGPDYDASAPSLAFTLGEGSAYLRVTATGAEARALAAHAPIPAVGDRVTVTGILRVRPNEACLYLRNPAEMQIVRATPVPLEIGQVTPEMAGTRVAVRGWVRRIRQPYPDLTLIELRDGDGEIPVAVSRSVLLLTGGLPPLSLGDAVAVTGTVSLYRDEAQIVPASVTDIRPSPESLLSRQPASLSLEDTARWVLVEASVIQVRPTTRGYGFVLAEEGSPVTLTLWLREEIWRRIPYSETLDVGARVRALGFLRGGVGSWTLVPELPSDLRLLIGAAPAPLLHGEEVTATTVGKSVCLEGLLQRRDTFRTGTLLRIDDGTAVVPVWMPGKPSLAPQSGVCVRACGWVAPYEDHLEIVIRRGSDFQVLAGCPEHSSR